MRDKSTSVDQAVAAERVARPLASRARDVGGFASHSERDAFERLHAELDGSGWVIAHNLYVSGRREHRGLHARELDLLLLHRDHGIVVVEVKGDDRIDRRADGTWLQRGVPMERNPERQANDYRGFIGRVLARDPKWTALQLPVPPIGIALCFPRADLTPEVRARISASATLGDDQIIDRIQLSSPGGVRASLSGLAARMRHGDSTFAPGFDWVDTALAIVSPALRFSTSLIGDLDVDEGRLEDDERIHRDWVENLGVLPRLHFEGGAGAGKSVVARLRARCLAEAGLDVLFVCSTAALARSFQAELARRRESRVLANTVHQALLVLARATGEPDRFGVPADARPSLESVQDLPAQAAAIAAASTRQFDALVVDEAQDVGAEVVGGLMGFLRDPEHGGVWTFADDYQRLGPDWADGSRGCPAGTGAVAITMRQNLRNPEPIFRLAEGLRADGIRRISRHSGTAHRKIDYRACSETTQRGVLNDLMTELAEQHIEPGRIAVVTMGRTARNPLFTNRRIGKWFEMGNPQLDDEGERRPIAAEELGDPDPTKVYFDSVRRMKGLERGAVVLVDVPDPGRRGSLERRLLYMGSTRATTYLAVIATPERIVMLEAIAAGRG